jgi:hypothetical protein
MLIAVPLAAAQDVASLEPQAGVLLLKNGQLMRGNITHAGDHYVVTLGVGGEVKIAAANVEVQCTSLEAAYDWKLRRLSGEGAGPHLDLAEWCLRHQLHRQCAQQLSLALATDAANPRIEAIDRRLQFAIQAPAPKLAGPPVSTIIDSDELDKTLRDLPKGTLERFTTIVQPILNNRCATSHCHGATSTSEFRLLRPPSGLSAPQRFTHRNLYAALQYIDREDPASSKLLTVPQEPHGGGKEPAFDVRSKSQLADLQKWIEHVVPPKEPVTPTTINPPGMQLSTPLRTPAHEVSSGLAPAKPGPPALNANVKSDSPAGSSAGTRFPPPWRPRDPFDPEIFNRQKATQK